MDRSKDILLIVSIALIAPAASALDFQVNVAPTPEATVYTSNISGETVYDMNASVTNPGSIGCETRLRAEISQGDQRIERYSNAYPMWPGETSELNLAYIPINYTGDIDVELYADYCELEKPAGNFSFEHEERFIPNSSIESKTLEANSSSAVVKLEEEDALLVPQRYPPMWKVGSARAEGTRAFIEYEPTLFRRGENITYTVVSNGTVEGYTKVTLQDQESRADEFFRDLKNLFRR